MSASARASKCWLTSETDGIDAGRQEQHLPAEDIDETRKAGDIDPGHVDTVGMLEADAPVVLLEHRPEFLLVLKAIFRHRVDGQSLFGCGKGTLNPGIEVRTAGFIDGMPHGGAPPGHVLFIDERSPEQVEVPGPIEGVPGPLLLILAAPEIQGDSGDGGDQVPVQFDRVFRARDAGRHLQVERRPAVFIGHPAS
jgi:hypothetical protein